MKLPLMKDNFQDHETTWLEEKADKRYTSDGIYSYPMDPLDFIETISTLSYNMMTISKVSCEQKNQNLRWNLIVFSGSNELHRNEF